jgi:hypothetical protein
LYLPKTKVTIYKVSGQLIAEKTQQNYNTLLQFQGLEVGMYLVKIQCDNKISTQKININ